MAGGFAGIGYGAELYLIWVTVMACWITLTVGFVLVITIIRRK